MAALLEAYACGPCDDGCSYLILNRPTERMVIVAQGLLGEKVEFLDGAYLQSLQKPLLLMNKHYQASLSPLQQKAILNIMLLLM
jgi:hypothetical protein